MPTAEASSSGIVTAGNRDPDMAFAVPGPLIGLLADRAGGARADRGTGSGS
jgi:hypothetical protein